MKQIINGKEYHSTACAARELGINAQALRDYMKNHKCSCEEAYNHFKEKRIIIRGHSFFSTDAVAHALNVNTSTFRSYVLRYDGDIKRACTYYESKGHKLSVD